MQLALEQAEELAGRAARIGNLELSALDLGAQERLERILQPLRARFPEHLRELGRLLRLRRHHAMQRDRLVAGDEVEERARDRHELRPDRPLEVGQEQLCRQFLFAFGLYHFLEQGFLVVEVAIDRELGDARLVRDRVHAGAVEALPRKQAFTRLQDRCALLEIFGPPGSGLFHH